MAEIKVPELGESIQEVQISQWLKKEGDWIEKDEDIVELESEKAAQSLAAPSAGVLTKILSQTGEFVPIGTIIAELDENAQPGAAPAASSAAPVSPSGNASSPAPAAAAPAPSPASFGEPSSVMPAAERLLAEYKISADRVQATGPGGRLLKEDVIRYIDSQGLQPGGQGSGPANSSALANAITGAGVSSPSPKAAGIPVAGVGTLGPQVSGTADRREETKPMSMIRRTIAARLVQAQQTAALLTTFNEIDMKPVMDLRNKYKDKFLEIHGVKLGFMSFFVKGCVEGLKRYPAVNSEIRGTDVITRNYFDIGIAIGGGKGLVVPILRNAETLSFAAIEKQINDYAKAAKENRIKPTDLEGGTFTISNGGVYGSLLSTPIVNPPQSGILGMHSIQERPIAVEGQVVIRPMMYIALTYDHRIVDGREAVGFLRSIKEVLEEPARLFLEV